MQRLKNGHVIAAAGQQHTDGDACRTTADDGHALAFFRLHLRLQMVEIRIGDVVFDAGKMHGGTLAAQHAVTLTLVLMIADKTTDSSQRIVFKKHFASFIKLVLFK